MFQDSAESSDGKPIRQSVNEGKVQHPKACCMAELERSALEIKKIFIDVLPEVELTSVDSE